MSTESNGAKMQSILVGLALLAAMVLIGLQSLYTAGQVYHAAMMAYKGGALVPHMISFGRLGVWVYLMAAVAVAGFLTGVIKSRGGVRKARVAMVLLVFSLLSTLAFVCLIAMPFSDVVSRS